MPRTTIIILSLIAFGLQSSCKADSNTINQSASERPNVLFIAADDLRLNLGCYGDKIAVTPHLDRLAAQGIVFERAYCQFPSCNASRASIITGMRPDSIRVWRLTQDFRELNPDIVTLPQHFKGNGYHTESIGKVLHNYNQLRDNKKSWSVPARFDQENHFDDYALKKKNGRKGKSRGIAAENEDAEDSAYADGRITEDAVSTIQRLAKTDQPFFLAVGFLKPHSPYNAPRKYWDLYRREDMKPLGPVARAEGVPNYNWFDFSEIRGLSDIPSEGPIPDDLGRRLRHGYYAATSFVDANVGRLLDSLEQAGIADNTIIVFWSDHGYHLGENDHWTKVMARDLDGHVPLIVKAPNKRAARTKAIVEYTDLYPTLAALCGLPQVDGLDGKSFEHIIDNPLLAARDTALTQVCRPWPKGEIEKMGYSLRTERYRYTQWVDHRTKALLAEELYDHDSDPLERNNLVSDPHSLSALQSHRSLMERNR